MGEDSLTGNCLVQPARQAGRLQLSLFWERLLLVGLFALGFGVRLLGLTNPPLEFHPTRQLRSAIIARGMYYQSLPDADPWRRQEALRMWSSMERYEPPLLERLVSLTYRVAGGEYVWFARVYSSLFWLIGGWALYALVRRALSPGAALFSLGFYLILPWGVVASRVFQPDPWMVMWVLLAAYALYRWAETQARSWLWTVLAGLFSGLAVLVKAYAVYPVAGAALAMLFTMLSAQWQALKRGAGAQPFFLRFLRFLLRPQLWLYAALAASIPAVYYLALGERSTSFASFWILSFSNLLLDRKFYIQWLGLIRGLMDVMVFFAALLGLFLFPARARALAAGLWIGYFLLGVTFPFQIYTHDYYSLVLVPIVALSLAPYADWVISQVKQRPLAWKAAFSVVFLAIAGYYAWVARSQVLASTHRSEPVPWQIMGEALPRDGDIIALTHDYGNRLKYFGWRMVHKLWPAQGDLQLSEAAGGQKYDAFEPFFRQETEGMDYFLVTLFGDLERQPELKEMLYNHYPIYQEGDGYVLFDLRNPLP